MGLQDLLFHLPPARVAEYRRRDTIYDGLRVSEHLHLVLTGRVKIFRTSGDHAHTIVRIVSADRIFGEHILVSTDEGWSESAVAIERVQVMCWTADQIEDLIMREPELGLALCKHVSQVRRTDDLDAEAERGAIR